MLLSQKQDPSRNESYNLIKTCKCVEYFWWIVDELHCMIYLSPCIFLGHGLYIYIYFSSSFFSPFFDMSCGHVAYLLWVCIFSLLLFFFLSCFLSMWHTNFGYVSFYFFLYSPYIMMITLERDRHGTTWSFICGWMDVLLSFKCRGIACE